MSGKTPPASARRPEWLKVQLWSREHLIGRVIERTRVPLAFDVTAERG